MNVTNLLISAGEAAGHPKHFAYFMPEDEGVDGLPLEEQRTLYMRNVHLARYSVITIPLAETLLERADAAPPTSPIETTLMPWIRGHDHGHNVIVPSTSYDELDGDARDRALHGAAGGDRRRLRLPDVRSPSPGSKIPESAASTCAPRTWPSCSTTCAAGPSTTATPAPPTSNSASSPRTASSRSTSRQGQLERGGLLPRHGRPGQRPHRVDGRRPGRDAAQKRSSRATAGRRRRRRCEPSTRCARS